jgi:hypothetical protein
VNPKCTLGATDPNGGWNRCYNWLALRYHNEKRALRAGTNALKLDPSIAKAIQAEMDKASFTGKIVRSGAWARCAESSYTRDKAVITSGAAVEYTNEASIDWYSGSAEYDPATGR